MIDLPLVSLDLELLDSRDGPEIIEIGAVKFRGRQELATFSSLAKPRGALSYRIAELTGIQAGQLDQAPALADALRDLSVFIGGAPLVGQSIGLDVEQLRRAGLSLGNPLLDTFELATILRPNLTAYDLQSVATDLGLSPPVAHRALADACTARDVFLALAERAYDLGLAALSQIVRLVAPLDWPLKLIFAEVQRTRVRELMASDGARDRAAHDTTWPPIASFELPTPLAEARSDPLNVERLLEVLGPSGPVADAVPAFEDRPEQREMLAAVAHAFNDGATLLVEAGTGTGKSLAYLLPALQYSVANERRVVVSTNTINLQDQLSQKDVPDLLRATGLPAQVAVLKGRDNYLCLRRWLSLLEAEDLTAGERLLLTRTLVWLRGTKTGDRAELRLSPAEEEAWSRVSAVAEVCSPLRCPYHRDGACFVARARQAAEGAHLLIVNHSLLLADMMTGHQVLPSYEHLVVDEAHHLEDEATAQLSRRVTAREMNRRLNDLAEATGQGSTGLLAEATAAAASAPAALAEPISRLTTGARTAAAGVRDGVRRVFDLLAPFVHGRAAPSNGAQRTVRLTSAARAQPDWSDVDVAWGEAARRVLALERSLVELIAKLDELHGDDPRRSALVGELAGQVTYWTETRDHLNRVIGETRPDTISWLSASASDELGVHAAPLSVGSTIRDALVRKKRTVVLTSATLTVEGSFAFVRERLGLEDADEVAVGSPFDYAGSTLIYIPSDGTEPGQPGYQRAVERVILDVASRLNGRTLALFTSHNQLRMTYAALRDPLDAREILLLGQRVQGGSRARMLETFKSDRPSVLLGTSSFWEGVDVVGEALSCLVMARLPFPMPTDPVFEARSEQFDDPFRQYSLPRAVLRFRQGFGRLIRSRTDRGAMVVLDGRLRTRGYRAAFLRSLPPCQVRHDPSADAGRAVADWVAEGVPASAPTSRPVERTAAR